MRQNITQSGGIRLSLDNGTVLDPIVPTSGCCHTRLTKDETSLDDFGRDQRQNTGAVECQSLHESVILPMWWLAKRHRMVLFITLAEPTDPMKGKTLKDGYYETSKG